MSFEISSISRTTISHCFPKLLLLHLLVIHVTRCSVVCETEHDIVILKVGIIGSECVAAAGSHG